MKTKKAGLLTKIVVSILLIYAAVTLLHVRGQIAGAESDVQSLTKQVQAQVQHNTELANAIENRDDPSYIKDIAQDKLGLVEPGEKVFNVTD